MRIEKERTCIPPTCFSIYESHSACDWSRCGGGRGHGWGRSTIRPCHYLTSLRWWRCSIFLSITLSYQPLKNTWNGFSERNIPLWWFPVKKSWLRCYLLFHNWVALCKSAHTIMNTVAQFKSHLLCIHSMVDALQLWSDKRENRTCSGILISQSTDGHFLLVVAVSATFECFWHHALVSYQCVVGHILQISKSSSVLSHICDFFFQTLKGLTICQWIWATRHKGLFLFFLGTLRWAIFDFDFNLTFIGDGSKCDSLLQDTLGITFLEVSIFPRQ